MRFSGAYAAIAGFLLFGMIQFRDGPFIRPHPGPLFKVLRIALLTLRSILEARAWCQPSIRARAGLSSIPRPQFCPRHDEVH